MNARRSSIPAAVSLLACLSGGAFGQNMDLHSHSYCSDGLKGPRELADAAKTAGLDYWALTDHDSIACIAAAQERAQELGGPVVVPGIEVSAEGGSVHILGLGIDPAHPAMAGLVRDIGLKRIAWMRQVLPNLRTMGGDLNEVEDVLLPKWNMERKIDHPRDGLPEEVTPADVRSRGMSADDVLSHIHGFIISPDIAKALVKRGVVKTTQEAFDRFMTNAGLAGVPFGSLSSSGAIGIIHAAGGIAILAHPYTIYKSKKFPMVFSGKSYPDFETFANGLLDAGLDGFELYKPDWTSYPDDALRIGRIVSAFKARTGRDLLLTPGSDYHGYDGRPGGIGPSQLGGIAGLPSVETDKILKALGYVH